MIADGYVRLNRHDDALRVLRLAVRHGFINHPDLAMRSTTFEPLRGNAAFQAILTEIEPRWRAVVEWEAASGERARGPGQ